MKKEGRIQGEYEKLVPSNFRGITRRRRGRERLLSFFPGTRRWGMLSMTYRKTDLFGIVGNNETKRKS